MSSSKTRRRTTVCLYFSHPLLSPELKRVLSEDEFRLLFRRTDDLPEALGDRRTPRATVYVVEALDRAAETEALAASIVSAQPGARVVVIGEKLAEENVFPLLRIGAKGMLTYSEVPAQLARALHTISEGGYWVPRTLLSRFVEETLGATKRSRPLPAATTRRLSRREMEVLELLLQNLSNKEIAKELHISSRTAKFHVSNLLAKHGVRRRADLILLTHSRTLDA